MTEVATHVLAAAGPLERADLPHFSDCLAPMLAAQYTPAVVPVGADRRPAWWPLAALAERLGAPILPDGLSLDAPPTTISCACASGPPPERRSTSSRPLRPPSSTRIARSAGWSATSFPDGRWDLAPEPLLAQLEQVADVAPLVLIPRRLWRRVNSYGRDLPSVLDREPADILVHPDDAAAAGSSTAAAFASRPRSAHLSGVVTVDDSIRRGAVAIPHGWSDPNVSALLSADENVDLLTGMPTYSGVPGDPQRRLSDSARTAASAPR